MKRIAMLLVCAALTVSALLTDASAATVHTVVPGDSLWKIAVKYEVGLSEIKNANTQIKNYDLI